LGGLVLAHAVDEDVGFVDLLLLDEFAAGFEGAAEVQGGAHPFEVLLVIDARFDHGFEEGHFEEGGEGGEEAVAGDDIVDEEVFGKVGEGIEGGTGAVVFGVEAGEGGFAGLKVEAAFGAGEGGAFGDILVGHFLAPVKELVALGGGEFGQGVVFVGGVVAQGGGAEEAGGRGGGGVGFGGGWGV